MWVPSLTRWAIARPFLRRRLCSAIFEKGAVAGSRDGTGTGAQSKPVVAAGRRSVALLVLLLLLVVLLLVGLLLILLLLKLLLRGAKPCRTSLSDDGDNLDGR